MDTIYAFACPGCNSLIIVQYTFFDCTNGRLLLMGKCHRCAKRRDLKKRSHSCMPWESFPVAEEDESILFTMLPVVVDEGNGAFRITSWIPFPLLDDMEEK